MLRSTGRLVFVVFLMSVQPVAAQRPAPRGSINELQVRVELASVLLQSRRYAEAAREYRAILTRYPNSFPARLGLARALAWGKHHREAERELRMLRAQRPRDREIESMLRAAREALQPGSREAAQWWAEAPSYLPYRRALARALVREGNPRQAVPHYHRLLAADRSRAMVREAVAAYVSAGEHQRAAFLLTNMLSRAPGDTATRHALASTFMAARRLDAALAQYDTLIALRPHAVFLLERANLHLARRDLRAAEVDVLASLRAAPSAEAYLLLGDVRRWHGDYAEAERAYRYAKVLRPTLPAVATASAQLSRDERPIPAFMPDYNRAASWQMRATGMSDNLGVSYITVAAQREAHLAHGIAGSIDVEYRHLRESSTDLQTLATGVAVTAGLGGEFIHGPYVTRLFGRAGFIEHGDASMFSGVVNAALWYHAWGVALEFASRPAYPALLSAAAIAAPDVRGEPLMETSINAAFGGPLGKTDFAANLQRANMSDDNLRSVLALALRYPFSRHVAGMLTGNGLWFRQRSDLYWDPQSYVAGAAGLELAVRKSHGFSLATRVLGGPARSVEDIVHTSWQLSGGMDLNHRTLAHDIGIAVTYGTGRADQYRRLEASFYATLLR